MEIREKLLELVDKIHNDIELSDLSTSLTINYENIISDYPKRKVSFNDIKKIIVEHPKIKSFNLTLHESHPSNLGMSSDYNKYWYDLKYAFHGKNKINSNFCFLSSQVHNQGKNISFKGDFTKIKKVGDAYKTSSKLIYKTLKSK